MERSRIWLTMLGVMLAGAALWWTFRGVDLNALGARLSQLGVWGGVIVIPYGLALVADTLGWRRVLHALGVSVSARGLYAIRLATEALLISAPAGAVVADTAKPVLMRRCQGVPVPTTVASMIVRKSMIVLTHGVMIGAGVVMGWQFYHGVGEQVGGVLWLPWLGMAVAVTLIGAALAGPVWFARRGVSGHLHKILTRISPRLVRRWLTRARQDFIRVDQALNASLQVSRSRLASNTVLFLLIWVFETVETWVILQLLGVDWTLVDALTVETACSFIRSAAFFVPAGLGVQALGYVGFLVAMDVPDAATVGGAFVILKRGKELFWVTVGYVTLAALRGQPDTEDASQTSIVP